MFPCERNRAMFPIRLRELALPNPPRWKSLFREGNSCALCPCDVRMSRKGRDFDESYPMSRNPDLDKATAMGASEAGEERGHGFCGIRSRILPEVWVSSFACWCCQKSLIPSGFLALSESEKVRGERAFAVEKSCGLGVRAPSRVSTANPLCLCRCRPERKRALERSTICLPSCDTHRSRAQPLSSRPCA